MVSTPAVRQATRDHFNCPTAEGALLEQDGGGATNGSHWESTIFQSEIMIGASAAVERRVLSPITLGLAQDSGWYVPNWDAQGFLRHGHLVGCHMEMRLDCLLADVQHCSDTRQLRESSEYVQLGMFEYPACAAVSDELVRAGDVRLSAS